MSAAVITNFGLSYLLYVNTPIGDIVPFPLSIYDFTNTLNVSSAFSSLNVTYTTMFWLLPTSTEYNFAFPAVVVPVTSSLAVTPSPSSLWVVTSFSTLLIK